MAEWSKAPVLKTGVRCKAYREFESRSLRQSPFCPRMADCLRTVYEKDNGTALAEAASYPEPMLVEVLNVGPAEASWHGLDCLADRDLALAPRMALAASTDQAMTMADRWSRTFCRTLRALRDLRRFSVTVNIQGPGRVIVGR